MRPTETAPREVEEEKLIEIVRLRIGEMSIKSRELPVPCQQDVAPTISSQTVPSTSDASLIFSNCMLLTFECFTEVTSHNVLDSNDFDVGIV